MGFRFRYSCIADRIAAFIRSNHVIGLKKPFAYIVLLLSLIWLFSSPAGSAYTAQNDGAHIRQKRAMEVSDLGILNPAGLAFSPAANAFYVIVARQQAQDSYTDIVKLTLAADRAGTARIGAAIRDPINMAFDEQHNRLLIFQADSNQLIEVLADAEGNLDPATLERHDARHFGLLDPQGMTIDQMSGHLFILDSAGPRILRIEPEADGSFDHAVISEVEDQTNDLVEPRGLAFDPTTGHIHVVNPAEQELYELTQTGQLVTTRDLAEFELAHPQGMVFAPSGDRTDDPSQMSLYLAESGGDALQGQLDTQEAETLEAESAVGAKTAASGSGDVLEFTFVESQAVSESTFQSSLVQTIEASQWDPPSPDTAGITYAADKNRLLVSDSEVNEMSIYEGVNLFEITLTGDVLETGTTEASSSSNEPTGTAYNLNNGDLFISDDNKKEIFLFAPGSDGVYGTADDIVTSFDTDVFSSGDPEGVAFDSDGQGTLYIVDGVNSEVYTVTPGPNGVFDGTASDDQVTSFDTLGHGLEDPEGVAFNPNTGTLYAVGKPEDTLFELTTAGDLVQTIDISAANADKPAGLAYAPGSQDSTVMNIYVAQRGVDNGSDPDENDGKIFEMTLPVGEDAPPEANDDSASTVENTTVTIDVAANDSDPNGNLDSTSANTSCSNGSTGCSDPTNGTLVNNGDGTFTYTPDTDFTGSDSFVYEICDTDILCDTATVSITVNVNSPPVANDDSASTSVDTAVTIDVAANDSDSEGNLDPSSANTSCGTCTVPSEGTLANNGDGTFTYTPNPGFTGSDSFVYQICDTAGACDTATATITVENIIDVRVSAGDDDAEEQEDLSVGLGSSDLELVLEDSNQTVGMRFNGIDVPQGATIADAYIQFQTDETDSDATSLTIQGEATDNALTFTTADGNISGRARTTAAVSWAPAAWTTRGEAGPDQQTPDIAPIIQEIVNRSGWASGNSMVIIITGSGKRVAESYNGDQAGAPLLHVEYTSGSVNDAPVANDDAYTTDEDTALSVAAPGVLGNDTDAEGDSLAAVLDMAPSNGSLTLNADGSFDYAPNADFNGTDSFTYRANDGTSDSNVATVSLTVNAVNDVPVAVDDAYTTDEDTALNVAAPGVLGNDGDVDGDALTAVLDTAPSNGSLTLNADGSFDYVPSANFNGADSFSYHANDGTVDSNVATVSLTVNAVNDAPEAADDTGAVDEGGTLNVAAPGVLGNDTDVEGDPLAVNTTPVTPPSNGSLTLNSDGSYSYTHDGGETASDSFVYEVSDGNGGSDTATVSLTVNAVNDAPVAVDDAYSTDEETTLNVAAPGVLGNDGDAEGDPLTAVLDTAPSNGSLTLNADGSFSYTPNAGFTGTDSFRYHANDGTADSNVATVSLTVNAVNDAPVAADDAYSTDEDTALSVAAPGVLGNDTDADGHALTAVLDAAPSNGSLTLNADGSFDYTPSADFNGTDSFTYHANDGSADSNVATVTITVNAVNDASVAVDDAYSTDEETTLNVAAPGVLGNDTDADGDALTAVLDAAPSNGSLTLNSDGSFDYTPNAGFTGTDSFSYHANDGTADSNVATVSITVNAVNDPLSVTGIDPNSAAIDSTVDVTVSGTGFQPGATLSLENGQGPAPDVTNVVVVDDSTLTATLIIKQGGPPRDRPWDVRVTNPDGQTDVLPGGFTVTYAAAATTSDTTTTSSPSVSPRLSISEHSRD